MKEALRTGDCAGRYGGDEFIIVMPEASTPFAVEVAERIRRQVGTLGTADKAVTMSIGVATFADHGTTPESVIAAADDALYAAKRNGRNRIAVAASGGLQTLKAAS